jgi:hypothetical protein
MKKLLFASVIAAASAVASIAPVNAASIEFNLGDGYNGDDYGGPNYYRHRYADDYYRNYGMYDDSYRPRYQRHYRQHCWTEQEVHWRHHHRVVEDVRVCRR